MKPFGPTFKFLRQEKGYSLKEVAHGIIAIPTLSKFENGHTDIKMTNFATLLSRLNLSYDEFIYFYKDESILDINKIISEFTLISSNAHDRLEMRRASERYQELYHAHGIDAYHHASIVFDFYSSTQSLNDSSKIEIIRNHLNKCEAWGKYEFFLYNCLSFTFSIEEIKTLSPFFFRQVEQHPKIFNVVMGEFIINQSLVYIRANELEEAETCLSSFYETQENHDPLSINLLLFADFTRGLIQIQRGNDKGHELCNQFLEILGKYPQFKNIVNQLLVWVDRSAEAFKKV